MRKPLAISALLLFCAVYALSFVVVYEFPRMTQYPAFNTIMGAVVDTNIAIDKQLYGDNSLFQAREEIALAYSKLAEGKADEGQALLKHAFDIRQSRQDDYSDNVLKALRHRISANALVGHWSENPALAELELDQALRLHNNDGDQVPDALSDCINSLCTVGKYPQAEHYLKLLDDWWKLQTLRAAMREHESNLRDDRIGAAKASYDRADFYLTFGQKDKARMYIEDAQKILNDQPKIDLDLSKHNPGPRVRLLMADKNYNQAIAIIQQGLADRGNSQQTTMLRGLLNDLGECYRRQGKFEQSRATLQKVLARPVAGFLNPIVYIEAEFELGLVSLDEGKKSEAESHFRNCIASCQQEIPHSKYVEMSKAYLAGTRKETSTVAPLHILEPAPSPPTTVPANAAAIKQIQIEPLDRIDVYQSITKYYQARLKQKLSDRQKLEYSVKLSEMYRAQGDTDEADKLIKDAFKQCKKPYSDSKQYVQALIRYYESADEDDDMTKEQRQELAFGAKAAAKLQKDELLLARVLIASARQSDENDRKHSYLWQALEIQQKELGHDDPVMASTMFALGQSYPSGSRAQALKRRARDILFKQYAKDFRTCGPLGQPTLQSKQDCINVYTPGFIDSSSWRLTLLRHVYGDDNAAVADAEVKEASDIDSATAPDKPGQPNPIAIAIPLIFLLGFAGLYIFVQRVDADKAERPTFAYDLRWKYVLTGSIVLCVALLIAGLYTERPMSESLWRRGKQKQLIAHAVNQYKDCGIGGLKLGTAALRAAEYHDDDETIKKREEYLRMAIAALEPLESDDTADLYNAYSQLKAVLEQTGRHDEAKKIADKAFQLSRRAEE